MAVEERFSVSLQGGGSVGAIRLVPDLERSEALFIYAPGAGSNLNDPFGAYAGRVLAQAGVETWRFQFPYMEAKRGAPDRPGLLEATWRAVAEQGLAASPRVVIGGRSMGGRIASQVVAQKLPVAGLALFAYPLHPPGRPEQRRDAHLSAVTVSTLFCSGTRDTYATPDELAAASALVSGSTIHLLDGADHGFNVLKASGRTREQVWAEATQALLTFLSHL
ncbi:MAG TPA: alpha/beta family hydrolase [Dehalococcoidia bacterium]|nr:alpha/beta family hydrolase [Dehalococcoidia bacterium]